MAGKCPRSSKACEWDDTLEARRCQRGTCVASRAAGSESRRFGSQEVRMTVHDYLDDDPLQPRYSNPEGTPPERYPEDDDDATEANDEDEDFGDEEDDEDEEDEDEEIEDE